jgi:predicted DNA-binding transcriptional regulator YafY
MEEDMARKRTLLSPLLPGSVSTERKSRLFRLVRLLGAGPQTLATLTRRLRLDVRGFYRDLELLRAAGISVSLQQQRYRLVDRLADALARLPMPDPGLTLGEAQELAKGRTAAHRRLKEHIARITR